MGSRYPVTPTEMTLQFKALMRASKRIRAAADPKQAGHAFLERLKLLIKRNERGTDWNTRTERA